MPFAFIFLLFIFLEIAGFVAMSNSVGLLSVFGLIALGIFVGGYIIRTIGLASVQRMQQRAQEGEPVGQEMGGLVLGFLGGVLLIVPGFLTDLIGIVLLIKPLQAMIWPRYGRQMTSRMPDVTQGTTWQGTTQQGNGRSQPQWQSPNTAPRPANDDVVIDADAQRDGNGDAKPDSKPSGSDRNPWGA